MSLRRVSLLALSATILLSAVAGRAWAQELDLQGKGPSTKTFRIQTSGRGIVAWRSTCLRISRFGLIATSSKRASAS